VVERKYHIIESKEEEKAKDVGGEDWNGLYNERNLCAKDYARSIFAHACLLACLLWVIMIFFFFIVGYEGGSESESEMRYPFFLSF